MTASGNRRQSCITANLLIGVWLAANGPGALLAASFEPFRETSFGAVWWADGPPGYHTMKGPSPPAVLCLRSDEIGAMFDTTLLRFLHAGRFPSSQRRQPALDAGTAPLLQLPPLDLQCRVFWAGKEFVCTGRAPASKDEFFQPVRFVEYGRFLQRVRVEGLQFVSRDGERLETPASLEISLWPDRLALSVELESATALGEGQLLIEAGGKRTRTILANSRRATLPLFEADAGPNAPRVQAEAAVEVSYDPDLACYRLRLPEAPWSNAKGTYYPEEHLDRLDRWKLTVQNDSNGEAVARLVFVQEKHLPITGFTPMLCDVDGTPSGLPVQISKNWHQRPDKGSLVHEGPWFHGCTMIRLPPRSRRDLVFQMVYARYGGVPAASHAQLSLIGWGHNQFWDEAAIGSFGESICYEPGRVQRRCMIDDIRPLMTLPVEGGKPWGWAGNCGGGDFLAWLDDRGVYRGFRATRAEYRAYGPCRTDVRYLEETAGGEITASMEVSITRSDDFLRAFHRFRYDVVRPVKFSRLAFYQLGADYYNETPSKTVAIGNSQGVRDEWTPPRLQGDFDRRGLALTGSNPWVSVHGLDRARLTKGVAAASRGLIVRSWRARLGGEASPTPHISTFCNEWGRGNFKTVVELSPPTGLQTLRPGDFVDAEIELVVFPADPQAYYGPNEEFRKALAAQADTWRLVHREAVDNNLGLQPLQGVVQRKFPLVVGVNSRQSARLAIEGGIGWLPVTFTGLTHYRDYELRVNGEPLRQSVHGRDFWQTDYDSLTGTWSQTFNLPRNEGRPLALDFRPAGR